MSVFRYRDNNIQIRWSFRENSQILVAVFKAPAKKPSNYFIFRARGVFRRLTVIKWAPLDFGHITNSQFCNYILKLSFRSLFSNLHQRIRFSQWQLSSAANISMIFQWFKEVVIVSFWWLFLPYYMATIVRALWLAAERALFSCNDRALWNFFSARRLFWVVSKSTCAWAKTTEKMDKGTTIFSITERKTSIQILL